MAYLLNSGTCQQIVPYFKDFILDSVKAHVRQKAGGTVYRAFGVLAIANRAFIFHLKKQYAHRHMLD